MTIPITRAEAHNTASMLKIKNLAFIDGKFSRAEDGTTFDTLNPATEKLITQVAHCGARDVDRAVKAARRVFNAGTWSRVSPEARKEVLLRLADLIRTNAIELAVLESIYSGKTITDCFNEIGTEVPNFFQWYAELIDKKTHLH